MTEKQLNALDTIIAALPDDCRESYRKIADYAIFSASDSGQGGDLETAWL